MLKPNPAVCCPDAHYCTTADITICPRHHHGAPCCTGEGHHTAVDRTAWHLAQDVIEERLLHQIFSAARDAAQYLTPERALGGVLDGTLGVVRASTLDAVRDVTLASVA